MVVLLSLYCDTISSLCGVPTFRITIMLLSSSFNFQLEAQILPIVLISAAGMSTGATSQLTGVGFQVLTAVDVDLPSAI